MRATMRLLVVMAGLLVIISGSVIAQDRPQYLTVTKLHRNLENKDITMDDWKALEKEYFDKVTAKNELIVGGTVLVHYFTADNTEIMFVNAYKSWEDIEKASLRNDELAKAAWPDEKAREA